MEQKAGPNWLIRPTCLFLGLSFSLLLASCGSQEPPSAAPPGPPPQSVAASPAPPPTPSPPPESKPAAPSYSYEPQGRRDPFQPPPELSPKRLKPKPGLAGLEVNNLKLAGIVWEKTDYYALVEAPNGLGYIIRKGAIIGEDTKVVKITKDSVEFEVRGRPPQEEARMVTLRLKKEE